MPDEFGQVAERLAEVAKSFHARGWLLGTSGNLSAVVQREPLRLAMSPSGIDKGELTPDSIPDNLATLANPVTGLQN